MNYRYEKKIPLPNILYKEINVVLKTLNFQFYKQYEDRRVNSIYLDTNNFDSYYESICGNMLRNKIRLRWYGLKPINKTNLEIKSKVGSVGTKKIYSLESINLNNMGNLFLLKKYINDSDLPYNLKSMLIGCYPTLYCFYDREYFISRNQEIRLTIDKNISYSQVKRNFILFPKAIIKEKNIVIEIKYNSSQDLSNIQSTLPFNLQSVRFSKYGNGIEYLNQNNL